MAYENLVNSKKMFEKAYENHYAIGAFNVNNMEIVQAITEAADELKAPVILQASNGARKYANKNYLVHLVEAACELHPNIPIVLHLDHGDSFETAKDCIDHGFTSVMIDGSKYDYEYNVEMSKKVADYAHSLTDRYVTVEAELGKLAGIEDDVNVSNEDAQFTDPSQVYDFVTRTGVDSLAIAIGTSHGAYKFKPGQKPRIRIDILDKVAEKLPGFPIVLHGASSVLKEYVDIVNEFGGNMPNAIGIPEDQLREAARHAVCKINIDSDLRLGMTAGVRKHFVEHPEHFDPREYLGDGRTNVKAIVAHKIKDVLGCEGKADECK